jgi:LEA14-like dessication related protein
VFVGWQDSADTYTRINAFSYEHREETTERTPRNFTLQGYDPIAQQWMDIQSYYDTSKGLDRTFTVDRTPAAMTAYSGYRLEVIDSNKLDSSSFFNIDALQFHTQDVAVDPSLFVFNDVPYITEANSTEIFLAMMADPTLDRQSVADLRAAASEIAITQVVNEYIDSRGSDVIIPTASDLQTLGYTDVTDANIDAVLSFLATAQERSQSAENAIAAGVAKQQDALNAILNWDDAVAGQFDNGALFTASGNSGTVASSSQWDTTTHKDDHAFDGNNSTYWASNGAISEASPTTLSWTSNNPDYRGVLHRLEINPRDAFNDRVPVNFDVMGYNPATGQWELIQSIVNSELNTTLEVFDIESNGVAYSGFKLVMKDTHRSDNLDNSRINLDEVRFITDDYAAPTLRMVTVSEDPTLLTYKAAGFDLITHDIVDLVNADLQFAKTEGVTVTAQYIEETINIRRLYQSILSENATSFATVEDQTALLDLVIDLQALTQMTSLADYQAQEATGFAISESDVELLLGAGYTGQYPTVADFVSELIDLNRLPVDQYDLQELASRDIHIVSLTGYDEFGFEQTDYNPGQFELNANELHAVVHLDDTNLAEGEILQLIIEGEVVDELVLGTDVLESHTATLIATEDEFSSVKGSDLNIVVRAVNAETGTEIVSEVWEQSFG